MLLAKDPRVELLAALYDEKNSAPKYEFLKGTIGKSYAFETALRYNIAQNLIAAARKNYGIILANASVELKRFAEIINAPVMTASSLIFSRRWLILSTT